MKELFILSILMMFTLQEVKTEDTLMNLLSRLLHEKKWVNNMDQHLDFECDGGVIKKLESEHSNYYEDRQWNFACKNPGIDLWMTNWYSPQGSSLGKPFKFTCPGSGMIDGVSGRHDNGKNDRFYNFRCSLPSDDTLLPKDCKTTDFVNEYDGKLDYTVPEGMVLTGVESEFGSYYSDRKFKFVICKMGH